MMIYMWILLLIVHAVNLFCAIQAHRYAKRAEVAAKRAEAAAKRWLVSAEQAQVAAEQAQAAAEAVADRSYNDFVRKYGYAPY